MLSETALREYGNLIAEALDPDSFLRSSGEAVARYDAAWKAALAAHENINPAMTDFLLIGSAHLDALEMASLRRPAMATMVSMLISVDMAKADTVALGRLFIGLHRRFLIACAELRLSAAGDSFAEQHAAAIMAIEARLFVGACDKYAAADPEEYQSEIRKTTFAALVAAAKAEISKNTPSGIIPDPDAPAEALVDIFSRLHALGLGD